MLKSYFEHEKQRREQKIPPLPLNPDQTTELCRVLENPPDGKADLLFQLLSQRVSPGVDPAAKIKAGWLAKVARGELGSPVVTPAKAVDLLGTMLGGYNVDPLISFLGHDKLASQAADALKKIILVYNAFDKIVDLAKTNSFAQEVLHSWANGEWFLTKAAFPEDLTLRVYKVDGETNTDDLSPAKFAWSRPDIPLHALSMGETRFPGGIETISRFRSQGDHVVFVGDVVGTGSSRKSATNSLLWHIGEEIPYVPNKRRGGIVIGGLIAPIFFNTVEDSGGLPLVCDVSKIKNGEIIHLDFNAGIIKSEAGETLASFAIQPATLKDEFRAGGRLFLIIGRS